MCCTPARPLRCDCVLHSRLSQPCRGACATDPAHLTRSGAVAHAGFNLSLSEGPMAELPE